MAYVGKSGDVNTSFHVERNSAKLDGGSFGNFTARTENVPSKSTGVFGNFGSSVKLFFKELFGMKVSTPDAAPVSRETGAQHLLSAMTKSKPDLSDVVLAATKYIDVGGGHGNLVGLKDGAGEEFKTQFKGLANHQLLRLANTFSEKLPELGSGLGQQGGSVRGGDYGRQEQAISQLEGIDTVLGEMKSALKSELEARGLKTSMLDTKSFSGSEPSRPLTRIVDFAVQNGGLSEENMKSEAFTKMMEAGAKKDADDDFQSAMHRHMG